MEDFKKDGATQTQFAPDGYTVRYMRTGYRHSKTFSEIKEAQEWADGVFLSAALDVVVEHNGKVVYEPEKENPEGRLEEEEVEVILIPVLEDMLLKAAGVYLFIRRHKIGFSPELLEAEARGVWRSIDEELQRQKAKREALEGGVGDD